MATQLVNIEGLDAIIRTLEALPAEIVSKRGGPVRVALRRAAVVVQKQAKINAERIGPDGGSNEATGLLVKSIVVSRGRPKFKGERAILRVRKAAKAADGTKVTTYAGVLEFGDERLPARGWMRQAWESKKNEALQTFMREMPRAIDQAVKRAKRKAGNRT